MMEYHENHRRHGGFIKFLNDFRALFIKTFLLTIRKPGQTIVEILLAYTFMGFLLGMRYILDRRYYPAYQIPPFYPQDMLSITGIGDIIYYYPGNLCATTIVTNAMNNLRIRWSNFPNNTQVVPDPTLSTLSNKTLQSIVAYIQFNNLDSCTDPSTMPNEVNYTLRMQENGPYYYHAQSVKISENDYLWKRSLEDFCQDKSSSDYYTYRFVGIQYFMDLSIIQYVTNTSQNLSFSILMNHFGCPEYYLDQLHSVFGFFIPIFFSIIFLITFIMNVGYIVEERQNKTKEYLRIYGLRTWINNLVWITRSMLIFFILTSVVTGLSIIILPTSGSRRNSVRKAIFNYTHWTLIWTILFVYSIQVSSFSVFFGQLFKRPFLAKLISFVVWILTLIDFYPGVPVGVRYFLCLFPNTGLMFCLQVILQYERKSNGMTTFEQLYSNLFTYPLYIGLCLLLMLIYSVIYFFLAIYIERINPGEFGVSQSWNYLFKKSYWKPHSTPTVQPFDNNDRLTHKKDGIYGSECWIELNSIKNTISPSLTISHLTKNFGKFQAVSDLSLNFYKGEVCSLLGHNGAGKTTTTFILVGMLEPTSGHVTIEGLNNRTHIQEVRKIIGFCPQCDILYNDLSVEEHLELIGKIRHMEPKFMNESIETILKLIGLVNDRKTLSKKLSGGMKRRLSIGISLMGDPKILILDEPTSGIDPYNRRLIWTIIRKMKEAGKCIILTTHFLQEADVLSDRIAIMTSGQLQANGTPNFLKNQIDFEYRLFIEKNETYQNERITAFIQKYIPTIILERESISEMIFGIKRSESKHIGQLIHALDEQSKDIGIESYGLSMTTIEEVFLKLIQEAETENTTQHDQTKLRQDLANKIFRTEYNREIGVRRFWFRICALIIKRWHVLQRQYIFLFGFFLFPILIEILIVSIFPTPKDVQTSLVQNNRIKDAQITLLPSIYNPHSIVIYTNNNRSNTRIHLIDYIQNTNANIDEISTDTVLNYVYDRCLTNEDFFVNKYQMAFAVYDNLTSSISSLIFKSYFSTVNYHAMATSLSVSSTNLFQYYTNSSTKKILTINQPILTATATTSSTILQRFFEIMYCFDTLPLSLFNFLNSILAALFISILIVPLIQERINHSKDLQLLTNLTKRTYWFSNTIFDLLSCFILCILLTIIIRIGSIGNPNIESEVHIYINTEQIGYFFLMIIMYSLASLPLIYVYSFSPKSELIGFINIFVINIVVCFFDMVLTFMAVFSQGQATTITRVSRLTSIVNNIRWFIAILFPCVNFKRSLFNIRLKSSQECISSLNSLMLTNYSFNESWISTHEPGVGIQFIIFIIQMIFWWIILILIEKRTNIKSECRRCCGCENDLERIDNENPMDNAEDAIPKQWDDTHLDEDVRNERRLLFGENHLSTSSVILVRDIVKRFKKRKEKSIHRRIYTAVDHLNFYVTKRSCFGLLGVNGAGKTTTFRMLINDLKPTSGKIIINGKDINKMQRDLEIGFCPQFDWLINNLTVIETLLLFARLKGLKWSETSQICCDMIEVFGLEIYQTKKIQNLSGGNKRKVSAALAFMANPALVFLDEPTTGLDAAAKRKLWGVIRAARDAGLTIILTSHSMEECEALCTKIGIMKLGQFMCLGNLQRLKNRFGHGYAVQVKLPLQDINMFKEELMLTLPGVQIDEQHNGILFCTVPFSSISRSSNFTNTYSLKLAHVFDLFNKKKEEKSIESYSITQTTLEQIFVHLAGEDQYINTDENKNK
ncbi:unnamed protein product [Rotaria sordida]|uniref:ABC transporter domain-containing protein n=1 Tax=Rotaria sordida TaxID=392033 RepID=A0A813VVF2_9BILA|nr:unnamed protein product [Rotaria sordida]